jgi:hypothetical protein
MTAKPSCIGPVQCQFVSFQRSRKPYAAGETMAELAREYECGEGMIWRALQ